LVPPLTTLLMLALDDVRCLTAFPGGVKTGTEGVGTVNPVESRLFPSPLDFFFFFLFLLPGGKILNGSVSTIVGFLSDPTSNNISFEWGRQPSFFTFIVNCSSL
jgi:hypothetical protein